MEGGTVFTQAAVSAAVEAAWCAAAAQRAAEACAAEAAAALAAAEKAARRLERSVREARPGPLRNPLPPFGQQWRRKKPSIRQVLTDLQ